MTCPPCASFFRRRIGRPLLLSCALAFSVVTTIATVSGLAGASRMLAVRAVPKKAAAVLPAPGATATFSINANGAKEVTSTGTPNQGDVDGTAVGTITFDNGTGSGNTGSATINLTLTNLDVGTIDLTGHHIHQAPSTTTGPIVIDFGDPDTIRSGNTLSGTITGLPAATITSLMTNSSGFYYNLHNAQFTGGAVRDQLGDASQAGPTLTVNSTADPGDGVCTTNNCTLREAITAANLMAGTNTITFDIAGAGPHTIQLASVLPNLTDSVDILNTSGESVTVRRNTGGDYRIFTINSGQTVNINGLTITNGNANGIGGGIVNNGGTLTLTNSTVSGNSASSTGGGIYNNNVGTLTLTNSTVTGNSASSANGGGIFNLSGTLNVTNSTVSGNSAGGGGGGIYINSGNATLTGVTITNNRADSNNFGTGGGIFINSGTPLLRSTIIAGNFNEDGAIDSADDIQGNSANSASSYNLIGTGGSGGLTNGTNNNQVGVADPKLGPLDFNGGPTQTHALLPDSPAIDKGSAFGSTTDQRGASRPVDLDDTAYPDAAGGDATDIGAFELQNSTPLAVAPIPAPSTNEDTAVVITLTGTDADDNNLTFTITDAPDNGSLVPLAAPDCSATNTCTQGVTYTPNADYFGADSFKFKVNDGTVDSTEQTVSITISAVNDAPSFTKGADQTVFNSAPQTIPNWATNLSAGPANESGQTLDFIVTNDNNALFAVQPAIDPSGTLSFTPALGMSGTATVSVQIHDNGGTANSGQDTSAVQTFVITVNLTGWTVSGANGATEDESNPQRPTYTNFTAAANPGSPVGTYVLRYNITAMGNLTSMGAVSTRLRVRFRDDGAGSQVTLAIVRSSILGGSETLGAIFDSDAYVHGSGFQTREIVMPPIVFDFTQNTYWLEVRLVKTGELNQPGIGSVQLNQQ